MGKPGRERIEKEREERLNEEKIDKAEEERCSDGFFGGNILRDSTARCRGRQCDEMANARGGWGCGGVRGEGEEG